jgi:hypothetical protein
LVLSGLNKGTIAIRLIKRAGKWEAERVWNNPDISMYLNSPVSGGDYLFGLSHKRKGQLFCLDARSGQTLWMTNGREGDNASILTAGNLLFMLNEEAQLTIARADPKQFELLKKYTVAGSATWAHPVLLNKKMLVKDATTLALLGFE